MRPIATPPRSRSSAQGSWRLALRMLPLAAVLALATSGVGSPADAAGSSAPMPLAMQSPWWENYDRADRYLCDRQLHLVLERNDSQASLITQMGRVLLFRESSEDAGVRYRNEQMRVILKGDELTLEQLPQRLLCLRTDQV